MRKKPRDLSTKGKIASYGVLTLFALFAIYPVLRVFSISIRPGDRLLTKSLGIIPDDFTFSAYYRLIFEEPFLIWMTNSLIISIIVTIVGTGLAVTAGYAFSRYRFKWREGALLSIITTQMFPVTMLLLPLVYNADKSGLV